ncbi:MAG: CHAT domain-containing protein, partial [Anaerolineae bacterium]|nr:CHAT domain-containing protein [Anaerolineae bacterium]
MSVRFSANMMGGHTDGSQGIVQPGQAMFQANNRQGGCDPARMLRILALLAAPVYDPRRPYCFPPPMDLQWEWQKLSQKVEESRAPIFLTRLVPPTLDSLRRALSPRARAQGLFPDILHFSGHAWSEGLLLEDELGQIDYATTDKILEALKDLPGPLNLVVLNGCESAADVRSVAQALVNSGKARAVVGHTRRVYDFEAVHFAAYLYAELTDGFPLKEAVARAQRAITTHEVVLLGDADLRFECFTGGEPCIDDGRPPGNLPPRPGLFFGRGSQLVGIAAALAHPPRVVVISGPATIGKTSLALEAAHRNAWRFSGGVAFAKGSYPENTWPNTADDFFYSLAEALGLRPEPGRVTEALTLYTDRQPTLLILDNVDTLPPQELKRLRQFLERLGGRSAALVMARSPQRSLEELPCAWPISIHEGIGIEAAAFYALRLAWERKVPIGEEQAKEIALATDGHPHLVNLLVAQARRRDLEAFLQEIRERRGDFQKQLEKVYEWSASLLEERGQLKAWQTLLLFPGGVAPESLLRAAAGEEAISALLEAALADFDPVFQSWRWHATVAEYARLHWPLTDDKRFAHLTSLLPEWTKWVENLQPNTPETARRLEVQQVNLEAVLGEAARLPRELLRGLLRSLDKVLPPPDRTLALRAFEERVYRTWVELAAEDAERATALGMLGLALSSLGRLEEALKATEEALGIYRGLAEVNPQAFLPGLAGSLNNLGKVLSDLGRLEEALKATEEALGIYR